MKQDEPLNDVPRIPVGLLSTYVRSIWQALGSSEAEAELVATHLVEANLTGHDSHGIGMIPRYVRSITEGELSVNAHIKITRDAGAVLTIDGQRGFGQVVAYEAMEVGIARAKQLGIAALGLRNAHHIGRIGHWAEQCARAGLISFHFVNVPGSVFVAPFGGVDARLGTNPFCAAFPRPGRDPVVLDLATSGIAFGKTRVAYNRGVTVPAGMLIDHEGNPTVDPKVLHEAPLGALTAFGGHKGAGLAAMCELFGGAVTGGLTTHADSALSNNALLNGMLSVLIDPAAFDADSMQAQADAFIDWMKAARLAPGSTGILMPGEPERAKRAVRAANGIDVDPTTWKQIAEAACVAGVPKAAVDDFVAGLK